jgi:hypothetical protein
MAENSMGNGETQEAILALAVEKLKTCMGRAEQLARQLDSYANAAHQALARAREAERERDELLRRHQAARAYLTGLTDTPLKATVTSILQGANR